MAWIRCFVRSLIVVLFACAAASADRPELGKIDFPNSGKPEAHQAFIKAVLLLHSFEYADARDVFLEVQRIDPDFAMAYWGEAMTHNHPLWRQQDREAALQALGKLASTPEARGAKTPTDRERGYLQAVEVLFGEGDKVERDQLYAEAMRQLVERNPDDLEARSFYALSILGTAQGQRDFSVYMRAGAVAEEIFDANPRHPGAVHYMIHSYDDPVHAPLGLRAARVYAQIAPAASHAQHMISHIYVALGYWAESVEANVKSFDVSVERRERKSLDVNALNFHSLHWLEYSYLQLGRFDDARAKLELMTRYAGESGSARALWYHAAMRAAWIVETGGREAPPEIQPDETQVTGAAADIFASGYAAWLAGDKQAVAGAVSRIGGRHAVAAAGHLCGQTGGYEDTSKNDLIMAQVLQNSLRALAELDAGRTAQALELLDEATAAEEGLPLEFGPPIIVKPSHELYGDVLLKLGRPAEARVQYEKALARAPRRSLSLAGLAQAASSEGDTAALARTCVELASIRHAADDSVSKPGACGGNRELAGT